MQHSDGACIRQFSVDVQPYGIKLRRDFKAGQKPIHRNSATFNRWSVWWPCKTLRRNKLEELGQRKKLEQAHLFLRSEKCSLEESALNATWAIMRLPTPAYGSSLRRDLGPMPRDPDTRRIQIDASAAQLQAIAAKALWWCFLRQRAAEHHLMQQRLRSF